MRKFSKIKIDKYKNLLFSQNFYDKYKDDTNIMKNIYIEKLKNFEFYYNKYDLSGVRIDNDVDLYSLAINIYIKIMRKELIVDEVLRDPDNILRNIIMLLDIDKYKFKEK